MGRGQPLKPVNELLMELVSITLNSTHPKHLVFKVR
jgi:hypothetical protein